VSWRDHRGLKLGTSRAAALACARPPTHVPLPEASMRRRCVSQGAHHLSSLARRETRVALGLPLQAPKAQSLVADERRARVRCRMAGCGVTLIVLLVAALAVPWYFETIDAPGCTLTFYQVTRGDAGRTHTACAVRTAWARSPDARMRTQGWQTAYCSVSGSDPLGCACPHSQWNWCVGSVAAWQRLGSHASARAGLTASAPLPPQEGRMPHQVQLLGRGAGHGHDCSAAWRLCRFLPRRTFRTAPAQRSAR
jgi:hypothetical protein